MLGNRVLDRTDDARSSPDDSEVGMGPEATGGHAEPAIGALRHMAGLARQLAAAGGIDELLHRTVVLAEQYVDGCDGASVLMIRRGGGTTVPAASSDLARAAALVPGAVGQGPCLEALHEQATVVSYDLRTERRWPAFRARVLELGVRSLIDIRLFAHGDTMGTLGCFSVTPHAFDDRSTAYAQVFASHAAVALKAAISENGLQAALRSRDINGQAKGIIMEREGLDVDAALERLRQLSQHRQQPLRDLAEDIVRTGTIPS
jgi:GAF domain-containing protein